MELERAVPQGSAGNFPAAVRDGQLCSGGHTEGGRYNSLDTPGTWKTTNVGRDFTVKLYEQASRGADYFNVHVTWHGYNPTTQPLKWSDLQLVTTTGKYAPPQPELLDQRQHLRLHRPPRRLHDLAGLARDSSPS